MFLIISSIAPDTVHVAHIPDGAGNPLCRTQLNRLTWIVVDVDSQLYTKCPDCLLILETQPVDDQSDAPTNP
jgi:hypothetical protein